MARNRNVVLSAKAAERIQAYLNVVDVTLDEAVSDAVCEWMEDSGELLVRRIGQKLAARGAGASA